MVLSSGGIAQISQNTTTTKHVPLSLQNTTTTKHVPLSLPLSLHVPLSLAAEAPSYSPPCEGGVRGGSAEEASFRRRPRLHQLHADSIGVRQVEHTVPVAGDARLVARGETPLE